MGQILTRYQPDKMKLRYEDFFETSLVLDRFNFFFLENVQRGR